MAVMAMMMVVVPVMVMTPVVMMPVMMAAPMGLLQEPGGRLAVRQRLRQSRSRRSLCRGGHHRPSQDGCGR